MRPLVILRPEPGASATVAAALERGLPARAIPLFAVTPVAWSVADPAAFDAIVATSANAFRHGGPGLGALTRLSVHAVGEATAAAARSAGFRVAAVGNGGRADLALPPGRLLHLAGEDHLPLAGDVETCVVYASRPIEPPPLLPDLAGAVVAVHSPRAGTRLAELVATRGQSTIAAISVEAARACGAGWEQVALARQPREAALLALAEELCQARPR